MWFFAFTFCWIYDRSAIAANNFIALLCYSTGRAIEKLQKFEPGKTEYLEQFEVSHLQEILAWVGLKKVIIVSGPIFFIVTASLGWRYAFTDPLKD